MFAQTNEELKRLLQKRIARTNTSAADAAEEMAASYEKFAVDLEDLAELRDEQASLQSSDAMTYSYVRLAQKHRDAAAICRDKAARIKKMANSD